MCVSPIRIVNPTKDFHINDPLFYDIPCTECEECRELKRYEFEIRVKKQMEWCMKNGYKNYFCTLTYQNSSLPYLELEEKETKEIHRISCFSREKIRLFMQNLLKQLKRKYNIGKKGYPKLIYFIASEYGGDFGRPHHHVYFGCPDCVTPSDLFDMVVDLWRGILYMDYHSEKQGFVYPVDYEGKIKVNGKEMKPFEVSDIGASSYYVSKYICKDLSFYENNKMLDNFLFSLKVQKKQGTIEEKAEAEEILKSMREYLPFHTSSKGFGACIIEDLMSDDCQKTVKNIERGIPILTCSGQLEYIKHIPMYIMRKLLFDVRYEKREDKTLVRYTLNDIGVLYRLTTFKQKVHDVALIYKNAYIPMRLSNYDNYVCNKNRLPSNPNFELLAKYKLCFKDRIVPFQLALIEDSEKDLDILSEAEFWIDYNNQERIESIAPLMLTKLQARNTYGFCMTHEIANALKEGKVLYNNSGLFRKYDVLLNVMDSFLLARSLPGVEQQKNRKERKQNIRHNLTNSIEYV